MKQLLRILVLAIFSLTSSVGYTQLPTGVTSPQGTTTTSTATPNAESAPVDGGQISTNGAARQGASSNGSASQIAQMIGQGLLATGTAMMPPCSASMCSCCPTAAMLIAMGILGLMQSGANKGTAAQHKYVASTSNQGNDGTSAAGYDTLGSLENVPGFTPSDLKKIDDLKKYGVTYKDGKFTMPNGKSFGLNDVNNPNAMANAGVSAADFAKAMAQAAALEKKAGEQVEKVGAHTASQGFENGVGGGGSSGPGSSDEEETYAGGGAKAARDPAASVAGMTKSYNGELIGVAGDSIFEMMARRYRQKSKEESFLPPESAPMSN